jgi:hypothetical protein
MFDLERVMSDKLQYMLRIETEFNKELASLPKGTLSCKKIKGHLYYYLQSRKERSLVSSYVPAKSLPIISQQCERRRYLIEALGLININKPLIEKFLSKYKDFEAISQTGSNFDKFSNSVNLLNYERRFGLRKDLSDQADLIQGPDLATDNQTKPLYQEKSTYYPEGLKHRTAKGHYVRSKSEVIIADRLYSNGIDYTYEQPLWLGNVNKLPDFTVFDRQRGIHVYWEHCGMVQNQSYMSSWDEKIKLYRTFDILEGDNLILSFDNSNGGLDSCRIQQIIQTYFLNS